MADDKGKSAPGALESLKYKSGEEASNDVRAMQTEMLVSKSEELAIKQAQKLIKKYRGMAVEADLQLRLAELYMRRAKSERFFELNRESEFAVKLAPQRVKSASSRTMIVKAVDIYDQIERRFKYFEKIDVVIFNNGFARQQLGQEKTAEKLYWRVIKNHNYSMLVPDSHLAIGEMAFRQKRFKDALLHFEAIKKYPQSRVYPYGLYKAAWTQYNLQRTEVAMKELESVVEFGKRVEEQQLDARLDLRKEALSDMALFYGEVYKPKDAYKYFSRHAKSEEIGDLLMKVSRIYARHGKFGEKDIVLRTFVDENPRDSLIPEIYDQLVWNYEDMKSRPQVVSQLEDFRRLCATNSRWAKGQKGEKAVEQIQGCVRKLQASAIKLAQKWLNLWEKNSSYPEFADSAERAYQIYLADNNDLEKANKARFAYAQLMFQRQKFSPASIEYEKVGRTTAEPQLGHESRYAAILSLEKSIKNNKWTNAEEERFKSLVQLYVTHHPQGKFRLDVEFKVGLIAY